ncbi:response regulator [Halorubellus sp. PRR65]|uniref:response regulator n=1 Tax=Halorubellus sp. PRR65 TaxID=3098148 RepID=UPI002B256664|nr:response regulator [Halorubellus sp. PRR65]
MTPDADPIEILLAEDNPGDVKLTEKAFEQGQVLNNFNVVNDGEEALQYLRQEGEYADAEPVDLLLLDLNMPRKSGDEVLKEMTDDPQLQRVPTVVLTSSSAEADIAKSYDHNANAYLTKPVDFDGLLDVVDRIEGFWLSVVRYPPERR